MMWRAQVSAGLDQFQGQKAACYTVSQLYYMDSLKAFRFDILCKELVLADWSW